MAGTAGDQQLVISRWVKSNSHTIAPSFSQSEGNPPRRSRGYNSRSVAGRLFQELHERASDGYDELPPLRRDLLSRSFVAALSRQAAGDFDRFDNSQCDLASFSVSLRR